MTDKLKKPVSRQRAYQLRMVADGFCSKCGKEPLQERELGKKCLEVMRELDRKRKASPRAWEEGKRGRPPIGAPGAEQRFEKKAAALFKKGDRKLQLQEKKKERLKKRVLGALKGGRRRLVKKGGRFEEKKLSATVLKFPDAGRDTSADSEGIREEGTQGQLEKTNDPVHGE